MLVLSDATDKSMPQDCGWIAKKDKFGKFAEAAWNITAANLPDLDFCEPLQDKAGLLAVASPQII